MTSVMGYGFRGQGQFALINQLSLYKSGASLAAIAGTYPSGAMSLRLTPYADNNSAITTTIQTDGSFTTQTQIGATGPFCVLTGQVSIIDVRFNSYAIAGTAACVQGSTATPGYVGLGFLTPASGSPNPTFTFVAVRAEGAYAAGVASK
jgi:hypothetical protein